jgi:hypothetical protein
MSLAPFYTIGRSDILFASLVANATLALASLFFTRGIGTRVSAMVVHVAMSNISATRENGLR